LRADPAGEESTGQIVATCDGSPIEAFACPAGPAVEQKAELVRRGVPQGPDVARQLREIEQPWVAAGFPSGDPLDAIVSETLA
jgi:poly(A) polymerase